MPWMFYLAGAVAVAATIMTITRLNAIHALLYFVVSLLAAAVVFYTLGAPFIAALEVIIYAGAIMVLFIFVVMMLNVGERAVAMERSWLPGGIWVGPAVLAAVLFAQVVYLVMRGPGPEYPRTVVGPKQVGLALYGPYLMGVELASMLLLAGLVAAYHLGWRRQPEQESKETHFDERRTAVGRSAVRAGTDRPAGAP
ncbi:MAG TPA: NADH-quinone oxidoreductase subunit J [Bryobacteraceae bacterium]|nr:NADH-quinone oxidoreductase subunit J [Bryobacteraceae bacterium]HPQ13976.1 NADH-quinone oxidoreductase subunit J [Bryobacteraceae bacterium]HPU70757.1 NADH-quinone oxidoreductase subunit J [Bryobacteraceae bacterium]